jgi:hypothetical protein
MKGRYKEGLYLLHGEQVSVYKTDWGWLWVNYDGTLENGRPRATPTKLDRHWWFQMESIQ